MNKKTHTIDVLIPVYNERENISSIIHHIDSVLEAEFSRRNYILVDDGSTDNTEDVVKNLNGNGHSMTIEYIRLAKNYGKDIALKCGIDHSTADVCAMIDADFQHPPEKILEAYKTLIEGYNVVHILKEEHNFGPKYRKFGSLFFQRLVNFLGGAEIHLTDFKLLDKKAIQKIQNYRESFYFSAGIIDLIGLKSAEIYYEPKERKHGESKFSLRGLIKLAINNVMAVSIKPLRLSIYFGLFISSMSFLYALYILFEKLFLGQPIPGFATLGTALFFMGGIQLLFLGIIGEYLGKTFIETKRRPQYIVDYRIQLPDFEPDKKNYNIENYVK